MATKKTGKGKKMTLRKFRANMSRYGMSRYVGEPEVWSGSSGCGNWKVYIQRGNCSVSFIANGPSNHSKLDISYEEACNTIDFHGIYFHD